MKTVWIYEATSVEDYYLSSRIQVFANEQLARKFWNERKQEIMRNVDADLVIEDEGDSLHMYEDGNACQWEWYDGIREYTVQE